MRLFVAVDLDEAARGKIAAEQRRCREALGDAAASWRWAQPDRMHLTLAFIGDADDPRADAIAHVLRSPFAVRPFAIAFGGVGVFPPRGAPNVLWLGVREGSRGVVELQERVAERLERVGVDRERRVYHPHVTLARARDRRGADRGRLDALERGAATVRTEVHSVTLYESRLSPNGPSYRVMVRTELTE